MSLGLNGDRDEFMIPLDPSYIIVGLLIHLS